MSLKLFFLRHGQTTLSRDNLFCGSGTNPPLTSDGEKMAQAFARKYQTVAWNEIYCSPLDRAVATAAPLSSLVAQQPKLRDELKEIYFGAWEGLTIEEVDRRHHDDHVRWSADPAWNAPSGGGETAIAIARRSRKLIEEIRESKDDCNVLLISHKATIRIMLCDLLGIDVSRLDRKSVV